jgi:hypothetical protein
VRPRRRSSSKLDATKLPLRCLLQIAPSTGRRPTLTVSQSHSHRHCIGICKIPWKSWSITEPRTAWPQPAAWARGVWGTEPSSRVLQASPASWPWATSVGQRCERAARREQISLGRPARAGRGLRKRRRVGPGKH